MGHRNHGACDRAYKHNRLCGDGASIDYTFQLPVSAVREAHPKAKFILRTAYFAPWNMHPTAISVSVNGTKILKEAQV